MDEMTVVIKLSQKEVKALSEGFNDEITEPEQAEYLLHELIEEIM